MEIKNFADMLDASVSKDDPSIAIEAGQRVIDGVATSADYDVFYRVASYIVEPSTEGVNADTLEAYYQYMDEDVNRWQGMIKSMYGDDWGFIAEVISKVGY